MTAPPLAVSSVVSDVELIYVGVGLVILLLFVVFARVISNAVVQALRRRNMHSHLVVVGGRVITVVLIGFGVLAATALAFRSANVAIVGIVFATVIASFGVQDLLKDYVSGYYIQLERHMRAGDRISLEGAGSGTITDVKLRVTLLTTDSGDLLVVPNSELFNKPVTVHVRAVERAAETSSKPQE